MTGMADKTPARAGAKKWLALPVAFLLLVLLALPVGAASANVEATLAQLDYLRQVDISPEWEPDIRANQSAVQTLLDLYGACSDTEKQEFTAQQKTDLRAYFEALYRVQGKDVSGVDALFAAAASSAAASSSSSSRPAASSSSQVASSSGSDASGSGDASDSVSGAASSSASAGSSSQPAPVGSGTASMPYTGTTGGQSGNGWFAIFSNRGLGSTVLGLLIVLVVALLVGFLVALRRTGKAPQGGFGDDIRAQELFGENYDPMLPDSRGGALNTESGSAPLRPQQAFQSPDFSEPDADAESGYEDGWAAEAAEEKPRKAGWLARRREKKQQALDSAFDGGGFAPPGEDDDPFAAPARPAETRRRSEAALQNERGEMAQRVETAARAAANDTFGDWLDRSVDTAPVTAPAATRTVPDIILPEDAGAAPVQTETGRAGEAAPARKSTPRGRGAGPAPDLGRNPDVTNSITMRSFSAQPRTGRPAKMTFRQGDPEDLDAIDE